MKCPNCGGAAADASECPNCGIFFAKWEELKTRKKSDEAKFPAEPALNTPSSPQGVPNPWFGRGIAAALVAAWMLSLGLYVRFHPGRIRRKPLGALTGETVERRDPVTGELQRLPIRRGPGVKPN